MESPNKNAEKVFGDLVEWWRIGGVRINPPLSIQRIDAFEQNHQICLPKTFRSYLLTADGMIPGETDEELIRFWSLEEIDEQNGVRHHDEGLDIVFADFSICSHEYVLRGLPTQLDDAPVSACDGTHQIEIADSFVTFVSNYMVDPKQIAYCWQAVRQRTKR